MALETVVVNRSDRPTVGFGAAPVIAGYDTSGLVTSAQNAAVGGGVGFLFGWGVGKLLKKGGDLKAMGALVGAVVGAMR